jgi:hypothetical protein
MSAGLHGDISKIRSLERSIRELPRVLGAKVAAAAAAKITEMNRATFAAGQNAYGDRWLPGVDGKDVDLRATGTLAGSISYHAAGTRLRAHLGPPYAKYVVGKRPVLPTGKLPLKMAEALRVTTSAVIGSELGKGG